jgi:capsular exopolysaccharide synthesis family protein
MHEEFSHSEREPHRTSQPGGVNLRPRLVGSGALPPPNGREPSPASRQPAELIYLRDYWRVVRRWWWVPLLTVAAALALRATQSRPATTAYEAYSTIQASRKLRSSPKGGGNVYNLTDDSLEFGTQASNVQSPAIAYRVAKALDLQRSTAFLPPPAAAPPKPGQAVDEEADRQRLAPQIQALLGGVKVTRVQGTRLVEIRFRHPDGATAKKVADAWAEVFIKTFTENCLRQTEAEGAIEAPAPGQDTGEGAKQLGQTDSPGGGASEDASCRFSMKLAGSSVEPSLVVATPAIRPNLLVVLFLSVGGGVGLTLLIDFLRGRVESVEDVDRYLGLPVLSAVPALPRGKANTGQTAGSFLPVAKEEADGSVCLTHLDASSPAAEAYRRLRAAVLLVPRGAESHVLVVTGSGADEGKTATAINLALALAQTGASVLLADCDLRRPRLHMAFGLRNERGLCDYLGGSEGPQEYVQSVLPKLDVLPAGRQADNATELLSSVKAEEKLRALAARYDYLVIESPAVSASADALILSALAGSVVFAVKAAKTPRRAARESVAELRAVGARILGAVVSH